ncbi:MAG: hypothetical protein GWN33_11455 [Gammaproteobacteria bacterium]|nr:pentapeptide repeat-containing protein [Deltaproteobacteria bacterium]NIW11095.1 hypothetical protein [Gammaproteobacteria bacterium]
MANRVHWSKLKEGVGTWNNWRLENPYTMPDLRGANLVGADLEGANLRWTDLRQADLRGAFLKKANLIGADLRGALLTSSNLITANLITANLRGALLEGANLTGADLSGANFRRAKLGWADLRKARNLSVKQLSKETKLYKAELDPDLKERLKKDYPHLFEKPKTERGKSNNLRSHYRAEEMQPKWQMSSVGLPTCCRNKR